MLCKYNYVVKEGTLERAKLENSLLKDIHIV